MVSFKWRGLGRAMKTGFLVYCELRGNYGSWAFSSVKIHSLFVIMKHMLYLFAFINVGRWWFSQ